MDAEPHGRRGVVAGDARIANSTERVI
jgi:hypothetical protein